MSATVMLRARQPGAVGEHHRDPRRLHLGVFDVGSVTDEDAAVLVEHP
jgi:hypothetical protein